VCVCISSSFAFFCKYCIIKPVIEGKLEGRLVGMGRRKKTKEATG
jgi:hypothetical protein